MSGVTDWVVAVGTAFSALFIGLGALFAVRQLRVGNRTNQLQAIIRVTDLLIEPEVMRARRWVLENEHLLQRWPPEPHIKEATECAQTVCRAFDRVGLLLEHKLVDPLPVLDMWSVTIQRLYEILLPFLKHVRTETPLFAHNFDYLYKRAREFNLDKGRGTGRLRGGW